MEESEDTGNIHFAGEIILEPSEAYHFNYNPEEQPSRPILKKNEELEVIPQKKRKEKFAQLKNIEGKILKKDFKDEKILSENFEKDEK